VAQPTYVRREEEVEEDGWTRTGVVIEPPTGPRRNLWYRVGLPEGWRLTESSDPFVAVPLFTAMRAGGPLHVEGAVSPSLLSNVDELQALYSCWWRGRFQQVEIVVEHERESDPGREGALTAFSGGLDSAFTVFLHATGRAGRQTQKIVAGVMALGCDIPVDESEGFAAAADKAEAMLGDLGIPLVRMATNVRQVERAWDDMMGSAIASLLMLLQPQARTGLVPSTRPYHRLHMPWGSHPLNDPLLSSASFKIVHDGAGFTRPQKAAAVAGWPTGLANLRVCWAGAARDRNCGRCSKCVRTILDFRAAGLGLPPCFDADASEELIRSLAPNSSPEKMEVRQILDAADERGVDESWVRATRSAYHQAKALEYKTMAVDHLRRRLRGRQGSRPRW
jgi:hypothetical protein